MPSWPLPQGHIEAQGLGSGRWEGLNTLGPWLPRAGTLTARPKGQRQQRCGVSQGHRGCCSGA